MVAAQETTNEIDDDSPYFHKEMLHVGTYHSPDGKVPVDAARIEHWAQQNARLHANGFGVPMAFDHGTTAEQLIPKSLKELAEIQERRLKTKTPSAADTIGKLAKFEPTADGKGCSLVFEITDPKAKQQARSNRNEISPVVLPYWKDGKGNEYYDICTHFDMVNHAVDHSQTPFVPLRLSSEAAALMPVRFSLGAPPVADEEKKDDEKSESKDTDGDKVPDALDDKPTEAPAPSAADPTELLMHQVIGGLRTKGIPMPDSCDLPTFLQAIMAALPKIQIGSANGNMGPTTALDQAGQVQQPGAQLMSSQPTPNHFQELATKQHREILARRLRDVSETGRCYPHEYEAKKIELDAVKLSLDSTGKPETGKLEAWITDRLSLKANALVPAKDAPAVTRLSSEGVQEPPGEFGGQGEKPEVLAEKEEDAAIDRQLSRMYGRKAVESWKPKAAS